MSNFVDRLRSNLATGHTATWLAAFITIWAIGVVAFSWYLATTVDENHSRWALAAILLYEVLP